MNNAHAEKSHPMADIAISVEDVTVQRGKRDVLRNISLTFEAGTVTAIVGPSGVGKTTLMSVLNGLLTPASGSIHVVGIGTLNDARLAGDPWPNRHHLPGSRSHWPLAGH
jgi:ABC-type transporter Mla maintaining outer membrane lipid asymmetry ATPase subunit MlaF